MRDESLANVSLRTRQRMAIHNLAALERARRRIADLLDCDEKDAERLAIEVRETYAI